MAPEGTARPGALSLPGMRNSALASAALTSVALLGQTAGATPSFADETPTREEVSRHVTSLYDRAETDSGTFNATRASSTGPRKRAARPADARSAPAAASRAAESRRDDPSLDSVTRQWFDAARAKLGPTVPAVLPSDRTPDRPAPRRPARAATGLERALDSSGRPALELPAAPAAALPAAGAAELTAEPAIGAGPMAELTAGPMAALPAAPEVLGASGASGVLGASGALGADAQATQVLPPVLALPAGTAPETNLAPAPAAEPQQRSALRSSKEQNQRKLDQARTLLSTYVARQSDPLTAPAAALPAADIWSTTPDPVQPSADAQWQALQAQSAADLTTVPPGATAGPTTTQALTTPPQTTAAETATAWTTTTPAQTAPAWTTTTQAQTAPAWTTTTSALTAPAPDPAPERTLGTSPAITSTGSQDTRAIRALEFARAQLGKPCVLGTTGPGSFDGPGLTQAAYKAAGISLPRTAQEQALAGQGVALTHLEPGDLVLYHAGHVGIYSGNGMMIHAPGPGAIIREESIHYAGESAIHSAIRPA
ncbi:NlpC/P60 family protein [Streptomyces sp. NPDC093568]|uniref:NlpC/P60 family protein n=1 Tax=Streptomyces sp. NPDC093568 TaxID=3366041 RepID=UPI0037FC21A2